MTEWFPSREWLESYQSALNDNDAYREASEGWGVDFAGDFVFEITRLPAADTTLADLPEELSDELRTNLGSLDDGTVESVLADAPPVLGERLDETGADHDRLAEAVLATPVADAPGVRSTALGDAFPPDLDDLLDQLERYLHDGTIYAYIDLYDGECRETAVLEDPDSRDPGFRIVGPYENWKDLLEGADVMESIFSEDLELDGSTTTIMPYSAAAKELGDTAGRLETRYLF